MKNKNIFQSIKCAISGIILAFKAEKNLTLYVLIAVIFFIFNLILKSSILEIAIFIILSSCVFAMEHINTAIERIVDKFILEKDENAKYIKDVAAGAVLICGIAFFVVEGLILIPKIF